MTISEKFNLNTEKNALNLSKNILIPIVVIGILLIIAFFITLLCILKKIRHPEGFYNEKNSIKTYQRGVQSDHTRNSNISS